MRLLPLLLASVLALAGCLGAPSEAEPAAASEAPPALEDALAALEAEAPSANVHLLGELRESGSEIDAWGDFLFVMRGGTVRILNVSDVSNITEVGAIEPAHAVLDVKVSDDGRYLFVGDDQEASGALGGTGPLAGGIYVYDVSDKTSPVFVSYQPIGERRGPHMVFYHRLADGTEVVLGANADVSIHTFDRESGRLTMVARYEPDFLTEINRDPQVFDAYYQGLAHDMFAMTEEDGTTLMYVANWDAGLRIVDITDPAAPEELGGWNEFPDGHEGNLHTVSTEWIGGRRITVGAVEVGFAIVGGYHYAMGTDANVLYVWDTTDPANIELLGFWQNPVEPHSKRDYLDQSVSSTHNLQLEGGRVYMAHYAKGVWVIDVSTPQRQASPEVVGYYIEDGMDTWDVLPVDGILFSSGSEGILALHFAPDAVGEGGVTGRA